MALVRVSKYFGALVVAAALCTLGVVEASAATAQARARASDATSPTEAQCAREATTSDPSLPMPRVQFLLQPVQLTWDGTITLSPAATYMKPFVRPQTIWNEVPKFRGGTTQLFLAYFSSTIPATLQPDGSLAPQEVNVLSWVLLTQKAPFDPQGMAIPPTPGNQQPPVAATCSYVGQGLSVWSVTTGKQIEDVGHVHTPVELVHPELAPWGVGFAAAKKAWEQGARVDAAHQGDFWEIAGSDISSGMIYRHHQTAPSLVASSYLAQLSTLPDTMNSSNQQDVAQGDTLYLDSYFGTIGLYGQSPPSSTTADFVRTLQKEARLGTLSALGPPAGSGVALLPPLPGATVACRILPSVMAGTAFGCTIAPRHNAVQYTLVGQIDSPQATTFESYYVVGGPQFHSDRHLPCREEFGQQVLQVIRRLGGTCT